MIDHVSNICNIQFTPLPATLFISHIIKQNIETIMLNQKLSVFLVLCFKPAEMYLYM